MRGRRNTLVTVAVHHVAGQFVVISAMEKPSGYYLDLKADSKKRYQSNVTSAGLRIDPYSITQWSEDPAVTWSDVVLYMVTTPSPYTLKEVKVRQN